MSIRVEPMVSVGQATAFLVPRGYTLAVCLEVAEATLGGLAMGVGMTTYSHKVNEKYFYSLLGNHEYKIRVNLVIIQYIYIVIVVTVKSYVSKLAHIG